MASKKEKLEKLITKRDNFLLYLNNINSKVKSRELTIKERDFLLTIKTDGINPKEYYNTLNTEISGLQNNLEKNKDMRQTVGFSVTAIFLLLGFFYLFFNPSLTGFVTYDRQQEYVLNVDQNFTDPSTEYLFNIASHNNTNNLTSLRITGHYTGSFRIKLVKATEENNQTFIVYDSNVSKGQESLLSITGLAMFDSGNDIIEIPNSTLDLDSENLSDNVSDVIENFSETPESLPEIIANISDNVSDVIENVSEIPINVSENITLPIIYENIKYLLDECEETCSVDIDPYNFSIVIEVFENSRLYIEDIKYTQKIINLPPRQIENIPNMTYVENLSTDLSKYFEDPENDKLYYDISTVDGLDAEVKGNTLFVYGVSKDVELFVYATDSEEIISSNTFVIYAIENISANVSENMTIDPAVVAALKNGSARVILKFKSNTSVETIADLDVPSDNNVRFLHNDEESQSLKDLYEVRKSDVNKLVDKEQSVKIALSENDNTIANDAPANDVVVPDIILVEQDVGVLKSAVIDEKDLLSIAESGLVEEVIIDHPIDLLLNDVENIISLDGARDYYFGSNNDVLDGSNVKICVLDTGMNSDVVLNVVDGFNVIDNSSNYSDVLGHGTSVGYIIYNISPLSSIVSVKVINDFGVGYESDILAGLDYCEQGNVSIISLSIGTGSSSGYCDENPVAQKVNELADSGILIVAGAGNDGSGSVKVPACARNVLAVSASTKSDALASFTSYNNATLLLAPGENILTRDIYGDETSLSGTSMSAPIVSAVGALTLQGYENFSLMNSSEKKYYLVHTGDLINNTERLFSRINVFNALIGNITNNLGEGDVGVSNATETNYTTLATQINSCQTLSSANTIYELNTSLSPTTTCMTIGANNVTLDCKGYNITGDASDNDYGIQASGRANVTVRNCNIRNFDVGIVANYGSTNGLFVYDTNISTTATFQYSNGIESIYNNGLIDIRNVNASVSTADNCYGLYFSSNYQQVNVTNAYLSGKHGLGAHTTGGIYSNITIVSTNYAIYAYGTGSNSVFNNITVIGYGYMRWQDDGLGGYPNNITINGLNMNITARGVDMDGANNTIDCQGGTLIGDGGDIGIYFEDGGYSTNNIVRNCVINNFTSGILLYDSANSLIDNVNITVKSDSINNYGIYVQGASNIIRNSYVTSQNQSRPFLFEGAASYNQIINVTSSAHDVAAIDLGAADYVNVTNCTFISNISNPFICSGTCQYAVVVGNTFISLAKNQALVSIGANTNHIYYWNNFTNTSGLYVNTSGTNSFNKSINGLQEGNIWYNVINGSVDVKGGSNSSFQTGWYAGSEGTGYPYNSTNSLSKVSSGVVDYAPLTKVLGNFPPSVSNVAISGTSDNNLTVTYTATDINNDSLYNVTDWRRNSVSIAVLNMPFNTNVSSTTAGAVKDYSTFGKNGTLVNGPVWNLSGKVGGAYVFDGIDDIINLSAPVIGSNPIFSISAWFKISDTNRGFIYSEGNSTSETPHLYISVSEGEAGNVCWVYDGNSEYSNGCTSASGYNNGVWHHAVLVSLNVSSRLLYVDGAVKTEASSNSSVSAINVNQAYIGVLKRGSFLDYFNGSIDEVLIFNRSLSAEEISSIYADQSAGKAVTTLVSNETVLGDNWTVCVTSTDKKIDSTAVCSSNYYIGDNSPIIRSSRISPVGANDTQTLLGYCNATINNGQNLTYYYRWYKNSILNTSGSTASTYTQGTEINVNNLSDSFTSIGEYWTLSCLASNTTANSSWMNSSIVWISNVPVSVSNVVISSTPGANRTSDNLTVSFTALDAEGEAVYNVTDWRRNGTSITLANLPFNKNVTSATVGAVKDYSTNGYNATLFNSPTWTSAGRNGGAYTLDGSNDWINLSNMGQPSQATIEFWFKKADINLNQYYMDFRDSVGSGCWLFGDYASGSCTDTNGDICFCGVVELNSSYLSNNNWNHVVLTFNSSQSKIYSNGTLRSTGSGTAPDFRTTRIGTRYSNSGYFNGTFDEVKFYNRILSPEQIYQNYLEGLAAHSLNTLVSNETVVGDLWSVAVTATDTNNDSATVLSDNMTIIVNNIPSVSNVVISTASGNNYTSENLTVSFTVTDPDNEPVYNVTDWRRNGTSIAVLNMPFNKNVNSTTSGAVRDYSTYGNNGTLGASTATPSWTSSGKVGGAYVLSGTDDYINLSDPVALRLNSSFTVMAWINLRSLADGAGPTIIARTSGNGWVPDYKTAWRFNFDYSAPSPWTNCLQISSDCQNYSDVCANLTTNPVGIWAHYTGVYDKGNSMKIYVNGTLFTSQTSNIPSSICVPSGLNTLIGVTDPPSASAVPYFLNGTIDEVLIFNRSLSAEEISSIYAAQSAGKAVTTLISNETVKGDVWSVAVTSTDTINDSTTTISNNLTIANTAPSTPSTPSITAPTTANKSSNLTSSSGTGSTDDDGDSITYYYRWKNDTATLQESTTPWLDCSAYAGCYKTVNITVAVRAYDGTGYSSYSSESTAKQIQNTPPTTPTNLTPITGLYNDTVYLNCSGSTDIDTVDTITYNIQSNVTGSWANVVTSDADGYYSWSAVYEMNSTDLKCNASDGTDQSAFYNPTGTIDIDSLAPRLTYNGSTGSGKTGDTITFNVTWNDTRLSTCIFEYYNGSLWANTTNTSCLSNQLWSLTKTLTAIKGMTINWSWIANDTLGKKNHSSYYGFLLANALPAVSSVVLSSTSGNNYSNDNLTVTFTATDQDNEPLYNVTDWRRNGTSIAVLNMPFNTNVSSTTAGAVKDYSTFGNNGTLGASTATPVWNLSGKIGGAYVFDGVDDYIIIDSDPEFYSNTSKYITIMAWVKPSSATASMAAVVSQGQWGYQLGATNSQSAVVYGNDGACDYLSINYDPELSIGSWTHLAMVMKVENVSDDYLTYYVNGSLRSSDTSPNLACSYFPIGTQYMYIGAKALATYFNGTIDEVLIFNRSLSAEEIAVIYANQSAGRAVTTLISNETVKGETWSVAVTSTDTINDSTTVLSNNLTIASALPVVQNATILPATAYVNTTLLGYCGATDSDLDNIKYNYRWFLNNVFNTSGNTSPTTQGVEINVANISTSMLAVNQNWTLECRADDGTTNSTPLNSSVKNIQARTPEKVTLQYPTNGNVTVHERRPVVQWYNTNHTTYYTINITSSSGCGGNYYSNVSSPTLTFTPTSDLCVDSESSTYYKWNVKACSPDACGTLSDTWNFSIEPYVAITLINSQINFSSVALGESKNTSSGTPQPFILSNDGNVQADLVNVSAPSSMWVSVPLNTEYLQMKARVSNESNSFNSSTITSWTYVTSSGQSMIYALNYSDNNDSAYLDLYIKAPGDEPQGVKTATISFGWEQTP